MMLVLDNLTVFHIYPCECHILAVPIWCMKAWIFFTQQYLLELPLTGRTQDQQLFSLPDPFHQQLS